MQLDAIDLRRARNKTLVSRICVCGPRKCDPEKKCAAYGQAWKQSNHTVHENLLELFTQYTRMATEAARRELRGLKGRRKKKNRLDSHRPSQWKELRPYHLANRVRPLLPGCRRYRSYHLAARRSDLIPDISE